MAWRIVKQPNGLLARFSEIVDNLTHVNMNHNEALELCSEEMDAEEAEQKVKRGEDSDTRWEEAVGIIGRVHGEEAVCELNALIQSTLPPHLNPS